MISPRDLVDSIRASGVDDGDVVFCHSNVAMFGRIEGCSNVSSMSDVVLKAFDAVIGPSGTLVLPAFTYSFGAGHPTRRFDPARDLTNVSAIANHLISNRTGCRSVDPMLSVIAVGSQAHELTSGFSPYTFGNESIWSRLYSKGAKICNLNLDSGSTYVHWIERELRVTYRRDVELSGQIVTSTGEYGASVIYTGRDLSNPLTEASFDRLHQLGLQSGVVRSVRLGRGIINCYRTDEMFELIKVEISKDPALLIIGRQVDVFGSSGTGRDGLEGAGS